MYLVEGLLAVSEGYSMTIMAGSVEPVGKHHAGTGAESLHPYLQAGGSEGTWHWAWPVLLKPQISPSVTHQLKQGHIFSNKAILATPSLMVYKVKSDFKISESMDPFEFKCSQTWSLISKQGVPQKDFGWINLRMLFLTSHRYAVLCFEEMEKVIWFHLSLKSHSSHKNILYLLESTLSQPQLTVTSGF